MPSLFLFLDFLFQLGGKVFQTVHSGLIGLPVADGEEHDDAFFRDTGGIDETETETEPETETESETAKATETAMKLTPEQIRICTN